MLRRLFCIIRKEQVVATPEELIRQHVLKAMIEELGYPAPLLAVEKSLDQMPHMALTGTVSHGRRADIICFARHIHPGYELYPLLLIECKAIKLSPKVINQVIGYNHYVNSYFVAVVNSVEMQTGWFDAHQRRYIFAAGLFAYQELLSRVRIQ